MKKFIYLFVVLVGFGSPVFALDHDLAHCEDLAHILAMYFGTQNNYRSKMSQHGFVLNYKNNMQNLPSQRESLAQILNPESSEILVHPLKTGDIIEFSDGSSLTLGEFSGAGDNTQIFTVPDSSEVVGVPTASTNRGHKSALQYYNLYRETAEVAREAGYPIIRTRTKEGLIFRQRLDPFYSLAQFRKDTSDLKSEAELSSVQREMLAGLLSLIEFLKGRTDRLLDVESYQIAWDFDDRKWIYIDFTNYIDSRDPLLPNGFSSYNNDFAFLNLDGFKQFSSAQSLIERYFKSQDVIQILLQSIRL